MKDFMKILMSLEDVSLSTNGVTQTTENKTKEQKGGFLGMLIATLGTNYSCDNVPNKMKNEAYLINHNEYVDIGTQWIALYVNGNTKTYFDSFGVEHIINEIKKFIGDKNITTNV